MRIVLNLAQSASGRLGGITAATGRGGVSLRTRPTRTQPRTTSQVNSRALLSPIAAMWRGLGHPTQLAWAALARQINGPTHVDRCDPPSGYALFVSCNRTLATIAASPILAPPLHPPAIPRLHSVAAQPLYSQAIPPAFLTGLTLSTDPFVTPPYIAVVRATAGHSPGRSHFSESDFRIIAAFQPYPTFTVDIFAAWLLVWGLPPSAGVITFAVRLIDPATGFKGPQLRCSTPFTAPPVPIAIAGTIEIDMNGVPIASIDDAVISFGDIPVAGGS